VLSLLSALHATQHFAKLLTTLSPRHISLGPWKGQADAVAGLPPPLPPFTVLPALLICVCLMTSGFASVGVVAGASDICDTLSPTPN
jgi:hypothetical protein